jgi:hypothetical protein
MNPPAFHAVAHRPPHATDLLWRSAPIEVALPARLKEHAPASAAELEELKSSYEQPLPPEDAGRLVLADRFLTQAARLDAGLQPMPGLRLADLVLVLNRAKQQLVGRLWALDQCQLQLTHAKRDLVRPDVSVRERRILRSLVADYTDREAELRGGISATRAVIDSVLGNAARVLAQHRPAAVRHEDDTAMPFNAHHGQTGFRQHN